MHYCTQLMRLQVKSHHLIPGKKWKIYIFNITYMYAKYLNYLPYHSWFLLEQHNLVLLVIWVIPCFFIFRIRQYNAMFKLCGVWPFLCYHICSFFKIWPFFHRSVIVISEQWMFFVIWDSWIMHDTDADCCYIV